MRKQLDPRIQTLIRTNVATHHRSFFVLVGDRARDQVINLHLLLSQARHTARPNVLWCYKKDLGFTTHRKKREAKIKRDIKRGIREKGDSQDPFELFVGTTDIRYCYYKDTPKILGRTFGMLILQDFEAMTPNMLARTIETVEGGGIVVLMLRTMSSLRQLYSVGMDVHSKYRSTMDPSEPVARFNERFLLSLGANPDTLFLDDELNVLPLSRGKDIKAGEDLPSTSNPDTVALTKLKEEVGEEGVGVTELVKSCKTLDQAKSLLTILDILSSSSLSSTVSLTAARGRGKSALLGLAMAASIAHGYSNIFVTSPSPENLKTLFEFLFKGLDVLGYEEVSDWSLQRGTGEWKDVVVRVNVFRNSRQTIQYIDPADSHVLGQAELVVIDEAAAIPLPLVRKLIGPYLVFLSSTINGYEGTGRSLSLKLIQQLRESASKGQAIKAGQDDEEALTVASTSKKGLDSSAPPSNSATTLRTLKEITLNEPIRYSRGDNIESWLNQLLCLDASLASTSSKRPPTSPHPSKCDLFLVNRDALFSYHPASELFLQKMMALYVSSHYKNSPNDLQLMSDAPSHRLFVLLGPPSEGGGLPEPLAVLQVSLEGNIARQSVLSSLSRGERSSGDLIPWTLSQQFQDFDFASLNGVRVVRLAVNPQYAQSGYGSRAIECLRSYFAGELADEDAIAEREAKALSSGEESFSAIAARSSKTAGGDSLQSETIALRDAARMPALLQRLSDRRPEQIDWLGVSFGLTPPLFRFWKKNGYTPLYIRQTANDLTGEYTTVMLRGLTPSASGSGDLAWLGEFAKDFRRRFNSLLSFRFRDFAASSALSILEAATSGVRATATAEADENDILTAQEIHHLLTPFDLKRLEAFGNNMLDYSVVLDLFPPLASLYFAGRIRSSDEDGDASGAAGVPSQPEAELPILKLSALQAALLLSIGLQRKDPSDVAGAEFGLPVQQGVALLAKGVRRILLCLRRVERREVGQGVILEQEAARRAAPASNKLGRKIGMSIEEELEEAGRQESIRRKAAEQQARPLTAIEAEDEDDEEDEDMDLTAASASLLPASAPPAAAGLDASDLSAFDVSSLPAGGWEEAEARVRALQRAREEGRSEEEIKRLSTVVSVRKAGEESGGHRERTGSGANGAGKKRKDARGGGDGRSKKGRK
ncbi:DUF699-domain-containing protein [Microstroma glucosiphilum]|uniref:RNA cytidine acetyltransferase n=1 Tax=Pseudomicrostroma glucosiphilum TaxID=1684307 RepID=A0A316TZ98_9BASI|nr:DUF699-domain-containing protein [Pseudomicrostroma glucosiphilum]PWN18549.1 DUF699-domain-containing protein [Pseudomicrostroma glucosiphilum]